MSNSEIQDKIVQVIHEGNDELLQKIMEVITEHEQNSDKAVSLSPSKKRELDRIRHEHLIENSPSLSLAELRKQFTDKYGLSPED